MSELPEKFPCDCCGLCCMSLKRSLLYQDLDRGDGICRFFEMDTRLCSIYENRPVKCSIDRSYELYLKDVMSKAEYYELNRRACEELKRGNNYVSGGVKK